VLRSVGPPGKKLPPSAISPGDLVYIRPEGAAGPGWGEEMRGTVQSLGQDGATISIALEKRYGDPATAKLFGRVLRVDRVRELADGVTYEVRDRRIGYKVLIDLLTSRCFSCVRRG
jgi:hypothetical protein